MKKYERKWKHICLKRQATLLREHIGVEVPKSEKAGVERKKSSMSS